MIAGVRGRLISTAFAETALGALCGDATPPASVLHDLERLVGRVESAFGPASSIRAVADGVALPLLSILGFDLIRRRDDPTHTRLDVGRTGIASTSVIVVAWDQPLDGAWRATVHTAIRGDARWAFCTNGAALRIVDAHRTWSRNTLDFDLVVLGRDEQATTLLWRVARAESLGGTPPLLDLAVDRSARYGVAVCGALAAGVIDALESLLGAFATSQRRRVDRRVLLDQSLTVLYRVLFLLFAEARGLVPMWHPVYRDRYTIDAIVSALLGGRRCRGLWAAITAISRLAHAGCDAGALKVTAFNGRLFAPAVTGAIDHAAIDDAVMARAVLAVSTTPPARGESRRRILYQDLDVEELGAVYEHVLDYEPAAGSRGPLARTRDLRKSTGTFYTPRSLTAYLVRMTLAPLLDGRSSEQILQLRILDPAMGSGAFLVAACAHIAEAAEEAFVREGRWHRGDVSPTDRIALRREVAQRCLFGVDLNPTAVQVARLSLWLTTLAADKPLTFLDHRLVAGNSLVGATPEDVLRQPPGRGPRRRSGSPTPLFESIELEPIVGHATHIRMELANRPDDSAAIVRAKEKTLAALNADDGALARRMRLLDLWCAGWFWPAESMPDRATFAALGDALLERPTALSRRIAATLLSDAARITSEQRFLHWPLAFPEAFHDASGSRRADAGFDAVIGNPPWDMLRGDSGDEGTRTARRDEAKHLIDFARGSGIYRAGMQAHVNRYQLFVERALQLVRHGGRIGFVLPSGAMSDTGSAPLRRVLFDRANVDAIACFDNRKAIFPIHRGLKFLLMTATTGEPTRCVCCRFGLSDPEQLDPSESAPTVTITRAFLSRLSGDDDLAIPDIQHEDDVRLLERISGCVPMLSSADGWHVAFGRELNASDDRALFVESDNDGTGRPVLEGKSIEPFRASTGHFRFRLRDGIRVAVPRRPRLAYRDVASATNRLTLIAAIVPASAVTTHTLFCLKTPLPIDAQHVLCAFLNSFVANYLVRFRVSTHVTVHLVSRLRVPRLDEGNSMYDRLSSLAQTLMHSPTVAERQQEYAELQALVARCYQLSEDEFRRVLSTFPLIPIGIRDRCLAEFKSLQ